MYLLLSDSFRENNIVKSKLYNAMFSAAKNKTIRGQLTPKYSIKNKSGKRGTSIKKNSPLPEVSSPISYKKTSTEINANEMKVAIIISVLVLFCSVINYSFYLLNFDGRSLYQLHCNRVPVNDFFLKITFIAGQCRRCGPEAESGIFHYCFACSYSIKKIGKMI